MTFYILFFNSCIQSKLIYSDNTYSDEMIEKWQKERDSINALNKAVSDINPYNFTDRIRLENKPENVYRIAVLGDSWIYGDGIYYKKTWSHLLEDKIMERYPHVEVLSWGLCGWSTKQQYNFYEKYGYKYQIDLIIVGFVENDPYLGNRCQPADSWQWQKDLYAEENLEKYSELIKDFDLFVKQQNADLIFVLTPLAADSIRIAWNNAIKSILDHAGIDYLDLYPAFISEFKNFEHERLMISPINSHPGELLNLFFMNKTFVYLKSKKYLKNGTTAK